MPAPSSVLSLHNPSPLDDLENVAGITVDEGDALDQFEDPMKTLKARFPMLELNLMRLTQRIGKSSTEAC
jgi:hypothetical protein